MAYDLMIRGGTLIDGTGAAPHAGDVAIQGGRIVALGAVDGPAKRTIEAEGRAVTPGFVDIHTHYDGQATWDADLAPSCWHGVTSAVDRQLRRGLRAGAPRSAGFPDRPDGRRRGHSGHRAARGHPDWEWETFPEFLDALERRRFVRWISGPRCPTARCAPT